MWLLYYSFNDIIMKTLLVMTVLLTYLDCDDFMGDICQNLPNVHLKHVWFITCQLNLKKAVKKYNKNLVIHVIIKRSKIVIHIECSYYEHKYILIIWTYEHVYLNLNS